MTGIQWFHVLLHEEEHLIKLSDSALLRGAEGFSHLPDLGDGNQSTYLISITPFLQDLMLRPASPFPSQMLFWAPSGSLGVVSRWFARGASGY